MELALFHLFISIIDTTLMFLFSGGFQEPKQINYKNINLLNDIYIFNRKLGDFLVLLMFIAFSSIIGFYFQILILNLLTQILIFIFIMKFFYNGTVKKGLFLSFMYVGTIILIEYLVMIFINYYSINFENNLIMIGLILTFLRILIITIIIKMFGNKEYDLENKEGVRLLLVEFLTLSYISITIMINIYDFDMKKYNVFSLIFSIVVFLMLLVFIELNHKITQKEHENKELKYREVAYKEYYNMLVQNELEVRRIKHDLNYRLIALSTLEEEDLRKEIDEIIGDLNTVARNQYTKNQIIQLIMARKIKKLEISDEKLNIQVIVPEELSIPAGELGILIGNSLDNCVEALEKLPYCDRELRIDIIQNMGVLTCKFENTYIKGDGTLTTTKKNKKEHGFGLNSIQCIVNKYDGYIKINQGNKFSLSIGIPVEI